MQIRCEQLRKCYPQGDGMITAVDVPRLEIASGETVVLLGVSGSGKTTLLRMLGLLESPTSGRLCFDGTDVAALSESRRAELRAREIGFVYQNYNLIPMLSAEENILLPRYIAGQAVDRDALYRLADLLGIRTKLQNLPETLSGGQQQRVAIARALINHPRLLLCDEPTGNLDAKTKGEVLALLSEVKRIDCPTMIIVTHDRGLAPIADRVLSMDALRQN